MRSFKFITLVLAVSLMSFLGQLALAEGQIGEGKSNDELATIVCNQDVVGLRPTGVSPPSNPVLANLAAQPEARKAAEQVLRDRLLKRAADPFTRIPRPILEDLAKICKVDIRPAIVFAFISDPQHGIFIARWKPVIQVLKLNQPVRVPVPADPPDDPFRVGFVFLFCIGGPEAGAAGNRGFNFEVNGTKGTLTCPRNAVRATGVPAKAGQTLTLTATIDNTTSISLFAEGGRFSNTPGAEVLPGVSIPPAPGPAGLGPVIDAATTFEHRKALILTASAISRPIRDLARLDILLKQFEECVRDGKPIVVAALRLTIPCDDAGKAAIAEEDLTGFYLNFAGERLVFGKPSPDKPFQQDGEEICQALLARAVSDPSPDLRFAAALAFMAPAGPTGAIGGVRFRREGQLEFAMLCPEKRLFVGREIRELQNNKRKFVDVNARLPFLLGTNPGGTSPELRQAAVASLAGAFADLQVDIIKVVKLNGLVDQKTLVALLEKLKFACETNPDRAEACIREKVLSELAIAASSKDARKAAGLGLGLLWEEWTRLRATSSMIIKIFKSPQDEARDGCGRPPYGAFCHALANNAGPTSAAPPCTICWPEWAAAAIPVLARHFAGRGAVLNFLDLPVNGVSGRQVTVAYDWGQLPCEAPHCP